MLQALTIGLNSVAANIFRNTNSIMEVEARSTEGSTVERVVVSLSRVMNYVAAFSLVLMMLLSVSDVFLRSIFRYSIPDSQELIQYLMVCVGFLAMAWSASLMAS